MTAHGCPPDADVAVSWVLGTLDGPEADGFARHLATCPRCSAEVARLQVVVDRLAESPAPARPPPAIRAQLMAAAREEAAIARALDHVDAGQPRGQRRPRAPGTVAVAVLALLVGAVGAVLLVRAADGPRPASPRTVAGTVGGDAGGPRARAALVIRGAGAELVLTGLAGPPRGRVYQAWIVRPPAAPLPTGALFSVPRTGVARVRLPDVRRAERVIVTAEPPRGSRVPSEPPRVIVRVAR